MILTKNATRDEVIQQVLTEAVRTSEPQLISLVEKIDPIDPFLFYAEGTTIADHRTFWKSAEGDVVIAGVGSVTRLRASKGDRFTELENQWKSLMEEAVVYDQYDQKGTGPVALGGFSFDPKKKRTELWKNFPDHQMTVPSYLLTKNGSEHYFTINALVFPDDHKEQLKFQWDQDRERLLSATSHDFIPPEIIAKEEIDPEEWKQSVKKATEDILNGKLDKVVLARELQLVFDEKIDPAQVLQHLEDSQSNSYLFAIESDGDYFVGATPERLVKVENRELTSACLAGTVPRGATDEEDRLLGESLLNDEKNLEEHGYVVQMIRDAVEACSEEVDIPEHPVLYPLKNLQHLYTPVHAKLNEEHTLLDVVSRLHPTPALGGLPSADAVDYIRGKEQLDRGWYAGPVGWFDSRQNGEFAVAIRSALLRKDRASLFSGCGVVKDSIPEDEYEETAVKLMPMLSVLGGAPWTTLKQ
ncbi:isochorismate synthase [Thalassobacillus hwangdonensis]|uniref:Isochorismate synthase MenF n=1 Tax=Thalassobacillus hwangdonensis TaxID=546108 RepID=A0ABW3L416_9BACI